MKMSIEFNNLCKPPVVHIIKIILCIILIYRHIIVFICHTEILSISRISIGSNCKIRSRNIII